LSSEPRAGHSFASEDEADDSLTFETRPVGDTCGSRKPLKRKAGVVLSAFTPACRRGNIALPIRRRRDYLQVGAHRSLLLALLSALLPVPSGDECHAGHDPGDRPCKRAGYEPAAAAGVPDALTALRDP